MLCGKIAIDASIFYCNCLRASGEYTPDSEGKCVCTPYDLCQNWCFEQHRDV